MLSRLTIQNLALIEEVEIEFRDGLTVMTGETGAGKSILIEGLECVLGGRGGVDLVRAGADRCTIEACFTVPPGRQVHKLLGEYGIEDGDDPGEIILRRVVAPEGRGRSQVNGVTIPTRTLRAIGAALVDIHGQHDHQSLLTVSRHREFIDAFGEYQELLEKVEAAYGAFQNAGHVLEESLARLRIAADMRDLVEFQLREIESVDPSPGEDDSLAAELATLDNAEQLQASALEMRDLLYDGSRSVVDILGEAARVAEAAASIDGRLAGVLERISSLRYEAEDVAGILRHYSDGVRSDPVRLEVVRERLASLNRLKRKHRGTLSDVIRKRDELKRDLDLSNTAAGSVADNEQLLAECRSNLSLLCAELSRARRDAADRVACQVIRLLEKLGIAGASFSVDLRTTESKDGPIEIDGRTCAVSAHGVDDAEFMISTNLGEELRPLVKTASGGEISRVMLALKSALAAADATPTLVFDEIDTGISGRIAEAVGRALLDLSAFHQVICITHLPQIARMGSEHIAVVKTEKKGRMVTDVRRLTPADREEEIARLLDGERISSIARRHASELLARS